METISQKIHNYNYAPGIATYGRQGETGQAGLNGSNLFFTNINLEDKDGLTTLKNQIMEELLPIKNSLVALNREYQNGDCFFTLSGMIYILIDIDSLLNNTDLNDIYQYFQLGGRISVDTVKYLNLLESQRLELNTDYNGFDIITSNTNVDINKKAVMNIVSDNIDENNNINMIQLYAINSYNIMDGQFLIYYDTNDNAFHISTNSSVSFVINSDLKVNNDTIERELDNYSSVLTSNDPITVFKSICSNITYQANTTKSGSASYISLSIIINNNDKFDLVNKKLAALLPIMFVKIYANDQIFTYSLADAIPSNVNNGEVTAYTITTEYKLDLNQMISQADDIDAVSLLYNTEIFINKK